MFLNFVCSLEEISQELVESIKKSTIIVVTDDESESKLESLGFITHRGNWLAANSVVKFDKKAAKAFGTGAHRLIVTLQIIYANDLVNLGYDIILQDVDVVWCKDIRKYRKRLIYSSHLKPFK